MQVNARLVFSETALTYFWAITSVPLSSNADVPPRGHVRVGAVLEDELERKLHDAGIAGQEYLAEAWIVDSDFRFPELGLVEEVEKLRSEL